MKSPFSSVLINGPKALDFTYIHVELNIRKQIYVVDEEIFIYKVMGLPRP